MKNKKRTTTSKKTLLIATGGLGTGGLERISCFVANHFIDMGWNVVIYTLFQRPILERSFQFLNEKVQVIYFDGDFEPLYNKKRAIFAWLKQIKKILRSYAPDSILAMTFKIGSLISLCSRKYSKRITVREINDPKSKSRSQTMKKVTEFLCRNIKNVIFQNNWEKSCYCKRISKKGVIIPNPITIQFSKKGSFTENKIVSLTRMSLRQKRTDILIKAFEIFHDKFPNYRLEIYGRGDDTEKIRKLIEESTCNSFIDLFDAIPNVHAKIIDYRCFVLTSDYEGMSNALLEAYSLGIPCISSDWPGVEDVITDGFDGLLYHRQDIEQLALLMCKIASDDELCKVITTNAISRSSKFDARTNIEKYCELIAKN